MREALRIAVGVLALGALSAHGASAQETCMGGSEATVQGCNAILQDLMLLQPRLGIAAAAGNPIAGASSTLGMRIGRVPRITVAGRFTAARADVRDAGMVSSLNMDAGVGVFSGFTLLPTIGGFGSIDGIASAGKMFVSDRVSSADPSTWAVGVRLGLLRESFTAPGVSVTGMYRRVGELEYSLQPPGGAAESFTMEDNSVLSLRGVVGKRLFVLGASVGIGYDRYESDITVERTGLLGGAAAMFEEDGYQSERLTLFGNVSWTMLILHLVAEGGWQEGGDRFAGALPASRDAEKSEKSTYYGSLAIRLAL